MIKLSARMKAITDQVLRGDTVCDIGTDHAILPIYLYKNGIAPRVILTDTKVGPLKKAKANLEKSNLLHEISDIRLGNGLCVIEPNEADTIIIAGMGGLLIADILAYDIQKTKTFTRFILQPRSAGDELRRWLNSNGFSIVNEKLASERSRICEIITAVPDESSPVREVFLNDMDFEVPPLLFLLKDPLLGLFVDKKMNQAQEILSNLTKSKSKQPVITPEFINDRLLQLKERKAML